MRECEEFFSSFLESGGARARLSLLRSQECNGPGDAIARFLGVRGAVETISSACASAALAIAAACDAIRSGETDQAIAGGSDSLCQLTYAGFNALRSVDPAPSRPFRADREGLSLGEGAAVLVLESETSARGRGARILGSIAGAGASCDAHHMTAPEPAGSGAAEAIRAALADAGRLPAEIDFINAHGTGTPLNDSAEWNAFREVFGPRAGEIPVTSTKGSVGHLLGAAGAIEALATVLCLARGEVHATAGAGAVDPSGPVRLVLGASLPFPGARLALSTSLAFGGSNAALVIESAIPSSREARA
jgi:3-oxoacyl-[acyl-carrier-protein] synthase II